MQCTSAMWRCIIGRYFLGTMLILVGGALYILVRPDDIFGGIPTLCPWALSVKPSLPAWVLYTLPDALWYAALLCFQSPFEFGKRGGVHLVTVLSCLSGPLHELLQLVRLAPGTFCPYDISTYFIILLIYILLCFQRSQNLEMQ